MIETSNDITDSGVEESEFIQRSQVAEDIFDLVRELADEVEFIDDIRVRLAKRSLLTLSPDELLLGAKVISSFDFGSGVKTDDAVCASVLAYGDRLAMAGLIDTLPTTRDAING